MKGLELCELYYKEVGAPMIAGKFPGYEEKIAVGLVGDGSECFGYDDELSRDHDWGPSFCLWLTAPDYKAIGSSLQAEYDKLPREFAGFKRYSSAWGGGRNGVFEINQFYKKFIGFDHVPANLREWRVIPEGNLAVATNGKIFRDSNGEFTVFRNRLKEFYPDDIRLKKMAFRCMNLAQLGQYNYPRCIKRKEYVAANYAESQFINYLISMAYLMNREYKPFYKWMHRDMQRLPILGDTLYKLLLVLVTIHEVEGGERVYQRKIELIEEASQYIIEELRREGISDSASDFLLDHGPAVQSQIQDPQIKSLNIWIE